MRSFPTYSVKPWPNDLLQQPQCHEFVDPYVEHDSLTILLDLILLKRGVYRHLLYNRGAKPRRLVAGAKDSEGKQAAKPPVDSTRRERVRFFIVKFAQYVSSYPMFFRTVGF